MLEIVKGDLQKRLERAEEKLQELKVQVIAWRIVALIATIAAVVGAMCVADIKANAAPIAGASAAMIKTAAQAIDNAETQKEEAPKEKTIEISGDTAYVYMGDDLLYSYDSYELLCACTEAEAADEPYDGKRMVVDVILNRVDTKGFPDTVYGVITQPYRFTSYWNGAISWREEIGIQNETREAVKQEISERGYPGLYYFQEGGYSVYGTPWKAVGNHYFSTL